MKTTTLQKRLDARYNGAKNCKPYQIVKDLIEGSRTTHMVNGQEIRPVVTSGSGRHISNQDYTGRTVAILKLLGLKFETGNDAPRGGLTGNFIKVLTKIERES
jgi:hypothetical protein